MERSGVCLALEISLARLGEVYCPCDAFEISILQPACFN